MKHLRPLKGYYRAARGSCKKSTDLVWEGRWVPVSPDEVGSPVRKVSRMGRVVIRKRRSDFGKTHHMEPTKVKQTTILRPKPVSITKSTNDMRKMRGAFIAEYGNGNVLTSEGLWELWWAADRRACNARDEMHRQEQYESNREAFFKAWQTKG